MKYTVLEGLNITGANHYVLSGYIVLIVNYEAQSVVNYRLIVSRVVPGKHA